ncbi:MAG: hypothetical protein HOQ05_03180 [Corynebacteriales bacterium]|nr:hypothetical protein [Mycobacteriales bacterium]
MKHFDRKMWAIASVLVGLMLLVVSCGGDGDDGGYSDSGSDKSTESPTPTPSPSDEATPATEVTVVEENYTITLSQDTFSPGDYTFKVANQGDSPHNLIIDGPGVDAASSPTLQPGESGEVSATLQTGSYELICGIGNHEEMGMALTIQVA